VVVNFTGGDTWAPSIRCVKRHGRLLTCGATAGFDPNTDIRYIFMGEIDIRGSTGFYVEDVEALLGLVKAQRLKPVIDRVVPLADGIEALRDLEQRRFLGKIVVKP